MAGAWSVLPWVAAVSAAALLAGCDNGPSAVADKQAADAPSAYAQAGTEASAQVDHRKDPVKLLDGEPEWAASRRHSAEENAQRAYARNGAAFGARSLEDYARKARAFVEHPPKDAETLTRANGDTLVYDAASNIFAVADKAGAPRTMFKPDDGAAYWQAQKAREARRQSADAGRRSHPPGDDAA